MRREGDAPPADPDNSGFPMADTDEPTPEGVENYQLADAAVSLVIECVRVRFHDDLL